MTRSTIGAVTTVSLDIRPDVDDPEAAEIWAQLTVDGVEHWAIVDTGARRTMLLVDDDRELDDEVTGAFGSLRVARHDYARLNFGPVELRNGELQVAPRHPGLRSVVGLDVIGQDCWHFDLGAKTMTRITNAGVLPNVFETVESGHVWMDLVGSTGTASAVWDTGAGMTVVDSTYRRRHADEFTADGHSVGHDVSGTAVETPLYRWRHVTVGGVEFHDVRAAEVDLAGAAGQLGRSLDAGCGYTLLRQATWTIDFPNRRWSTAPA